MASTGLLEGKIALITGKWMFTKLLYLCIISVRSFNSCKLYVFAWNCNCSRKVII